MTVPSDRKERVLSRDEQWGPPRYMTEWGESVRFRVRCQIGGRLNPFMCINGATVAVGRKKLCRKHAGASR